MGDEDKVKNEKPKEEPKTENRQYDVKNGVNLTDVVVVDKDGNKSTVTVKFKDTSSDSHSSDNKVDENVKTTFEGAVKEAAKTTTITEITVTATTNGDHDSSASRHYAKNGGKAVDIGGVNGKSVSSIGDADPVKSLQNAFENQTGRRENYGPSVTKKSGEDKSNVKTITSTHQNHIHWSVD